MGIDFDVLIVGGGPAGASCAAVCACNGLKTAVLERCAFPREKVCGDCINPGCWAVIDALDLRAELNKLPHAPMRQLEFSYADQEKIKFSVSAANGSSGVAVKRSLFDYMLLENARQRGVYVNEGKPVVRTEFAAGRWLVDTNTESFSARWLIAADGRNSSVCRMNGIYAKSPRNRVALQTYAGMDDRHSGAVGLKILPIGYCGYADVGADQLNVCLVGKPRAIPALKAWSAKAFRLPHNPVWQTISPIERRPAQAGKPQMLLIGDAARVVEPFTGEGIRYAMESGLLAGQILATDAQPTAKVRHYQREWKTIYTGRLWINCLAREAVKNPWLGRGILAAARAKPEMLGLLSSKVTGSRVVSSN